MSNDRPFSSSAPETIRAILRAEFGYSDESLARIADGALAHTLHDASEGRKIVEDARANVPDWIEAGHTTEDEARRMTGEELVRLRYQVMSLDNHQRTQASRQDTKKRATGLSIAVPDLSRNETLTLLAQVVSLLAAQQTQIDELTNQVATLTTRNVVLNGRQKVLDQLLKAGLNMDGIDITMRVEERSTILDESAINMTGESKGSRVSAKNLKGEVEGIAKAIAGLNVGGAVNLSDMNERTQKLKASARREAKVESSGEVRIQIAKVSAPTAPSLPSGDATAKPVTEPGRS